MIFHGQFIHIPIINFVQDIGYGGVDVFLLLSGWGLHHSLKKSKNISSYYYRRFIRIIPVFVIASILHAIFIATDKPLFSVQMLKSIGLCFWYIPCILYMYAISPLIYRYQGKWQLKVLVIFHIFLGIWYFLSDCEHTVVIRTVTRFPIFTMGFYFAKNSFVIENKTIIIIASLCFAFLYFTEEFHCLGYFNEYNSGLSFYPFVMLSPIICVSLIRITRYLPMVVKIILSYLGTISLELYLSHVFVQNILLCNHSFHWYYFYPISFVLAYLMNRFNVSVSKTVKKIKIRTY